MRKQVMTMAVKLARKMEGDWIARMKMALKMAWAIVKKGVKKMVKITTASGSRKYKSWVAEIVGRHPKFNFERKFIEPAREGWTEKEYELAEGKVYEVCNVGEREFVKVENGKVEYLGQDEVTAIFA